VDLLLKRKEVLELIKEVIHLQRRIDVSHYSQGTGTGETALSIAQDLQNEDMIQLIARYIAMYEAEHPPAPATTKEANDQNQPQDAAVSEAPAQ
jgi:hypothetical protein